MNLFSNQGVVDNIDLPALALCAAAGRFGREVLERRCGSRDIGFEVFGPRVAGAQDESGSATRSGGRISGGAERSQLGTDAAAHGDHADGLGEHVGGGGAGWAFLFAEFADVVCDAGRAGAFLCGEFVELGAADTGGTRVALGESLESAVSGRDSGSGERGSADIEFTGRRGREKRRGSRRMGRGWRGRTIFSGIRCGWERADFTAGRIMGLDEMWMRGRDERSGSAAGREIFGEREILSRARAGWAVRRTGAERAVQREPNRSCLYRVDRAEYGWRVGAVEVSSGGEAGSSTGRSGWIILMRSDLEYFQYPQSYGDAALARNHAGFANVIYRPRSDLLFSAEYRRIVTDSIANGQNGAGHLNLMWEFCFEGLELCDARGLSAVMNAG